MQHPDLQHLKTEFDIAGAVALGPGQGDMPRLRLAHDSGAQAEIYLQGAHVTSWRDATGKELLFLSRESAWAVEQPIRGGIPVCWPQFSRQGPLPHHGFARTSRWQLIRTERRGNGDVAATLRLSESPASLALWPHCFTFEMHIVLSATTLALTARIDNTDARPFEFQLALHTYFGIADIRRTKVLGLAGTTLIDMVDGNRRSCEERAEIGFAGETDRIYNAAPDLVRIREEASAAGFLVRKDAMQDLVIWNPWQEKAKTIADLDDEDYLHMLCVEAGNIVDKIRLAANESWQGGMVLSTS